MSQELSRLLEIIAQAERAALIMDGAGLRVLTEDLETRAAEVLGSCRDQAGLATVRDRLVRFRRLCQFVGESLHEVLTKACERESAPYKSSGQLQTAERTGLLERCG